MRWVLFSNGPEKRDVFQRYRRIGKNERPRRPLLQFQADLLGVPIHHASIADATALGCAFLTGLQMGFWEDIEKIKRLQTSPVSQRNQAE